PLSLHDALPIYTEGAMATFRKVVEEHATPEEAGQALRSIENIYLDSGDASGYVNFATSANIRDLSPAEQDNLAFQAAHTLFSRGQYQEIGRASCRERG